MSALNRIGSPGGGCVLLSCVALALGSGCAARVYSEPAGAYPAPIEQDAVVYVDTVPPNIEVYPHYYYGGTDAYYVEGRWYRRGPRGWGYYRQEPPELARQRPSAPYVVREVPAPAVRRERTEVERAPAAPRERRYVQPEPAEARPAPGVVEVQPRSREAAPRERPIKRPEPPSEHEREHER